MQDGFKIYVDSLRDGHIDSIDERFPCEFLDIHEQDLSFKGTVDVKGETYVAEDDLILHLDVKTSAIMPCAVCNAQVTKQIEIDNFYFAVPIKEIKGAIFDFTEILREAVLLELPYTVECKDGHCPHRSEILPYLKHEEGYRPFKELENLPEED